MYNRERIVSSINHLGRTGYSLVKKKKLNWNPILHHAQKLKLIKDLNLRLETGKLLKENIGIISSFTP